MAAPSPEPRVIDRLASLALILEWALGLRVLAADLVHWSLPKGALCVFPDTKIYWALAGTILTGEPYEVVDWGDLPHFALRTPGYPLFLAACRALFGERPLAARLVQAALGALSVWLVYRLACRFAPDEPCRGPREPASATARWWTMPLVAAALAALHPYLVLTSALLLSEGVFLPLMLAGLWGVATLWTPAGAPPVARVWARALGTGLAWGAAVLVRPSWALFVPATLLAWIVASGRGTRREAAWRAGLVALGVVVAMAPWWVRNQRVFGRFVPTAIWMGASLYDGLNPKATGASDMDEFMAAPEVWPLDEETQDAVLRDRALAFVRDRPGRAAWLALVKLARYWSPWPNAATLRSPVVLLAGAAVELPLYGLILLGAWDRRRDLRGLVLLAGPLAYFCALHLVFASSMRYRIPGEMPALVLAAIGFETLRRRARGDGHVRLSAPGGGGSP